MKTTAYRLYGLIGWLMKPFRIRKNKVFLFMVHDCHFQGNIRYVYDCLKSEYPEKDCVVRNKRELLHPEGGFGKRIVGLFRFVFGVNFHLMTSETVFLNDNFLPLAYIPVRQKTKLVQLWHGAGAFKRFGLDTEPSETVRKLVEKGNRNISYLPVTADFAVPIYAGALGIAEENIHPIGLPLMDFYFDEDRKNRAKEAVYQAYPELRGTRIILYAPTLRTGSEQNEAVWKSFDGEALLRAVGDDARLLVRFHPTLPKRTLPSNPHILNVTEYPDSKELMVAADWLITDYSSLAVEYSLLRKPLLLYAPDLHESSSSELMQYDRGYYMSFEDIDGGIAETMDECCKMIGDSETGILRAGCFLERNFTCPMKFGYTKRMLREILEESK